jgi:hypothetical protein
MRGKTKSNDKIRKAKVRPHVHPPAGRVNLGNRMGVGF